MPLDPDNQRLIMAGGRCFYYLSFEDIGKNGSSLEPERVFFELEVGSSEESSSLGLDAGETVALVTMFIGILGFLGLLSLGLYFLNKGPNQMIDHRKDGPI